MHIFYLDTQVATDDICPHMYGFAYRDCRGCFRHFSPSCNLLTGDAHPGQHSTRPTDGDVLGNVPSPDGGIGTANPDQACRSSSRRAKCCVQGSQSDSGECCWLTGGSCDAGVVCWRRQTMVSAVGSLAGLVPVVLCAEKHRHEMFIDNLLCLNLVKDDTGDIYVYIYIAFLCANNNVLRFYHSFILSIFGNSWYKHMCIYM